MARRFGGWTHDVLVIGAGSAGLTVAGGCARLGLRVALVERDRMGGECLNTGCVPSKALLAAAHRAHAMRRGALGIAGHEPDIDFAAVRAHVQAAIAAVAPHDSEERFAAWGVEVVRGEAAFTGRRRMAVAGRALSAPRIVLATGSAPAVPDLPGLSAVPYLTNETLFGLEALPRRLLVLGGGPVAVEMAQAFRRLGAGVTVLASGRILPRDDAEAVAILRAALLADGVVVREGMEATGVDRLGDGLQVRCADGTVTDGSHLLVATGRRARLEALRLGRAGVAFGTDGIQVDAYRRTGNRAVYAIGDCRAGPRFTHAAGYEGALVVSAIGFGLRSPARYDAFPAVTYTAPELAQIGLTEADARARHRLVTVSRQAFADNDRAVAEGDTAGFVKLVHAGRRLVGVTIVGRHAGELVVPWGLMLAGKASAWALANAVVPYPTRSELSKAAAFAGFEPALFGRGARRWAAGLARLRRVGRV